MTIAIVTVLVNQYEEIIKTALPHLADHLLGKLERNYKGNCYMSMCYLDETCLSAVIKEAASRTNSAPIVGDNPTFTLDDLKYLANRMWAACQKVYGGIEGDAFFEDFCDLDRNIMAYLAKYGYSNSTLALLEWRE